MAKQKSAIGGIIVESGLNHAKISASDEFAMDCLSP